MKIGLTVTVAAALALGSQWCVAESFSDHNIQIRVTHARPAKDDQQMEFVHRDDPQMAFKELVFVGPQRVAGRGQIKSARVVDLGDGQGRVEVALGGNKDGDVKPEAGEHVAVIVGGRVCGVAQLSPETSEDRLELAGDFTLNQARALAERINAAERP